MNRARRLIADRVSRNNLYTHLLAAKNERVDRRDQELELAQLSDVATDFGRITAGFIDVADGALNLSDYGLIIVPSTFYATARSITWLLNDGTGYAPGWVQAKYAGTTPNRDGSLEVVARSELGGSGGSLLYLRAQTPDGSPNYNEINIYSSLLPYFLYRDKYGNSGSLHYGDYAGYAAVVAASTTPTSGYSRTIRARSMGANGFFTYDAWFRVHNTGATNVGCTFDPSFGGSSLLTDNFAVSTGTNSRYLIVHLWGTVSNQNSVSSQATETSSLVSGAIQGGVGNGANGNPFFNTNDTSVNTDSADRDFDITCTLSTPTNSELKRLGVIFRGPYYA